LKDLVIDFGLDYGILLYRNGSWSALNRATAKAIVPADINGDGKDELVIDFGSRYGILIYAGGVWSVVNSATARSIVPADINGDGKDELVMDFGPHYGIYIYADGVWSFLNGATAGSIVKADVNGDGKDDLVIDFGKQYGILTYTNGVWNVLNGATAKTIVPADINGDGKDELVIDFGEQYGILVYTSGAWSVLNGVTAKTIVKADLNNDGKDELVIDFGSQYGIYTNINGVWGFLNGATARSIVAADLDDDPRQDLVIDFGARYGIWAYLNNTTWLLLHTLSTEPVRDPSVKYSVAGVEGYRLMVRRSGADGALDPSVAYIMKGVCWSPASIGTVNTYESRSVAFAQWVATDAPLMAQMNVNTVRTYTDIGLDDTALSVLDTLYANGIMAVMSLDNWGTNYLDRALQTVQKYKNHPAILMWLIGNEWNVNCYYTVNPAVRSPTAEEIAAAAQKTQDIAARIKQADPYHLVATSYGDPGSPDLVTTEDFVRNICPDVDVWGFNVYNGPTFNTMFSDWNAISDKPMFLSEFGCDSYDVNAGGEDQAAQADFEAMQWDYVAYNLSAKDRSKVCVGGSYFEWNDEWWKAGGPLTQDPGGWSGPFPDGMGNEDYWGLVKIGRELKLAYTALKERFDPSYQVAFISLEARSKGSNPDGQTWSALAQFYRNGARFYYGQNPPNRGINVAVVNNVTGLIDDTRAFDTFAGDADALVAYLSGIAGGKIIMFAIADEGTNRLSENEKQALESLGSTHCRQIGYRNSWAMITKKGSNAVYAEDYGSGAKSAVVSVPLDTP
ncbi:MAG: interleukin-like EMT inducer domain-containing protein, partial [Candidatus Omnitrophica bacterium]|nr:interleukin-like EMT inducer domain-containing protein [Candidatus Omnitrophota bacterium]